MYWQGDYVEKTIEFFDFSKILMVIDEEWLQGRTYLVQNFDLFYLISLNNVNMPPPNLKFIIVTSMKSMSRSIPEWMVL